MGKIVLLVSREEMLHQAHNILQHSVSMQECIRKARLYSMSESPVLIKGETGTEVRLLAQGIHNSSLRSAGSFLAVSCLGMGGRRTETEDIW